MFATKAESKKYFSDSLEATRAAGWDGSSRVVQTDVWELGSGMVSLLVDFERLTSEGIPIDAHRVIYTLVRVDSRWLIAGYVAVDPDYLGPGDVLRTV